MTSDGTVGKALDVLDQIAAYGRPVRFSEMLAASPKGTVPVLVISPLKVIEQSLAIMLWALGESDPDDLLHQSDPGALPKMLALISQFDDEFKTCRKIQMRQTLP